MHSQRRRRCFRFVDLEGAGFAFKIAK